ncbi:MAG: ATP-binding protein [Pseudomonadota bacterium]
MNRRLLLSTLVLFGAMIMAGAWGISAWVDNEARKQLDKRLSLESIAYRSVIQAQQQVSDTLFEEVLAQPEVTAQVQAVISQSGDAQDIARGQLLRKLYPSYLRLSERGTRQLHFHTPDGRSLLRFHNPVRYGDPLFEVRESVRLANTRREPVQGYEAGRLFHGFRYVYPLFHQGQHIGSVEASVAFRTVERQLQELVPNEQFMFVLERDQVFELLYPSERSIYSPFALNEAFLVEDVGARLGRPREVPELQRALVSALEKKRGTIREQMSQGKSFGLLQPLDDVYYAAMFLPIDNVSGDVGGYIVTFADVPGIGLLYRNGSWFQWLFIVAMVLLGIGYYRRKHGQHLIRQERRKLQAITDRMAEGLLVQDPQGRISYLNRAAEQILGVKANAMLGRLAHDLFHVHYDAEGRLAPISQCPIRLKTEAGEVYQSEDEYFRRLSDHELIPVQLTSAPFVVDVEQAGSITIFRDITERKRYEQELKRARSDAEASARVKADFLANMSHEIRTPMNGVIGMLDLALETPLSAEQRDFLQVAHSSSQTLMSLLNGILDLAKLEAGQVEPEQIVFALCDTLEDTVKLFATQAQGKGLEIAVQLDAQVPVNAVGDPTRLRQVISNLLGNAIKFTHQGDVTLYARLASPPASALETTGFWLEIRVTDTGMGIAPEAQAKIFDSFQQADNSTTRHFGGTGLGLALSREIAAAMGGSLSLTSVPGEGSTFSVHLPFGEAPPQADTHEAFLPLGGQRVLIAVGHPVQRQLVSHYCERFGTRPQAVESCEAVLPCLLKADQEDDPFAVLIVDRKVSQQPNATRLCDTLHQYPRFAALPVWHLVTYTERLNETPALPIAGTLVKPVSRQALYAALVDSLESSRSPGNSAPAALPAEEHSAGNTVPRQAAFDGLQVLLVEDNPVNRKVAMANLTKLGCQVISALNGAEALAYLQDDNPVDIVLMDCMMPVMDGLEATQRWREHEHQHGAAANARVPIIAMTAYASDNEIAACYTAGMDAYLSKPFKPEALASVLRQYGLPK